MSEIIVHHLNASRSQRILFLLEELELDYSITRYQRDKNMRAPDTMRAIHPLGRSPIVTVDGTVLVESGAVIEEILDRFGEGRLRPEHGSDDHRLFRFWLHYAEGSLMPPLLVKLIFDQLRGKKIPFFVRPLTGGIASQVDGMYTVPEIRRHLDFINDHLKNSEWLAGEFTAADIQMSYPIQAAMTRSGLDVRRYGALSDYLTRLRSRPAFKTALQKGGEAMP